MRRNIDSLQRTFFRSTLTTQLMKYSKKEDKRQSQGEEDALSYNVRLKDHGDTESYLIRRRV